MRPGLLSLRSIAIPALLIYLACGGIVGACSIKAITGLVMDQTGNPLVGVTVTLLHHDVAVNSTMTSEDGGFRFQFIPIGSYTLVFTADGYQETKIKEVKVATNNPPPLVSTMKSANSPKPILNGTDSGVSDLADSVFLLESSFLRSLPGIDHYNRTMELAGGVVGRLNVHGATSMDNGYYVDGIDVRDPVTGEGMSTIPADAIEAIEVITGGFGAEYGRVAGGIANISTRSDRRFHLCLRGEYHPSSWRSHSFYEDHLNESVALATDDLWLSSVTIGGPALQGKLLYLIATQYSWIDDRETVLRDPYDDPRNPHGHADTSMDCLYPYIKLTFQPHSNHSLITSYSAEVQTENGVVAHPLLTEEATSRREFGGPYFGLEWRWTPSNAAYLNAIFSQLRGFLNSIPSTGDTTRSSYYDNETGVTWGAPASYYKSDRTNTRILISGGRPISALGGQTLKAGLEYSTAEYRVRNGIPSGRRYSYNSFQPGQDPWNWDSDYYFDEYTEFIDNGNWSITSSYLGLYAVDQGRFTPYQSWELGLRLEHATSENDADRALAQRFSKDHSYKTETKAEVYDYSLIAPRLTYTWNLREGQAGSLRFFLGRYYNPLDLQVASMLVENYSRYQCYRRKLADDAEHRDYDHRNYEWSEWRETDSYDTGTTPNTIDPALQPEHTDEALIGYEYPLSPLISIGATALYKRTKNIVEDTGVYYEYFSSSAEPTGRAYLAWQLPESYRSSPDYSYQLNHYYVTNPPRAERNYADFAVLFRATTTRLTFYGSYTFSYAEGSTSGEPPADAGDFSHANRFTIHYDTPELCRKLYGKLPYDTPQYLKLAASYTFFQQSIYAFTLGAIYSYRTGYAYSRLTIEPTYNETYAFDQYGRGTYRLPALSLLDIRLQKDFALNQGKLGTASVILDIYNLFNAEYLQTRHNRDRGVEQPWVFDANLDHQEPRRVAISLKFEV